MFFFMAQVPVICIEQLTLNNYSRDMVATKTTGSTPGWQVRARGLLIRIFGYIWVVSCLLFSGWPFLDIYFRVGMASWKVPFPVLGLVLGLVFGKPTR